MSSAGEADPSATSMAKFAVMHKGNTRCADALRCAATFLSLLTLVSFIILSHETLVPMPLRCE
jgi:hypothetical protein